MKRFTKTMKMVAAMLSLCIVCAFSISVEAADAKYKTNVIYVCPEGDLEWDSNKQSDEIPTNSKNQYYSVDKMRMSTYDDENLVVVYPKNADITVSTSKKAMEASIVKKINEDIVGEEGKKMYVTPNVKYVSGLLSAELGENSFYYDIPAAKYFTREYRYDYTSNKYSYEKKYVEDIIATEAYARIYDEEDDEYYYRYVWKNIATGVYHSSYSYDVNTDKYTLGQPITVDRVEVYGKFMYDGEIITDDLWLDNVGQYWYYGEKVNIIEIIDNTSNYYAVYNADGTISNLYNLNKTKAGYYYYYDNNITVCVNQQTEYYDDGGVTPDYEYAKATIKLTSTKAGSYKVNITVNGVKKTVKVLVDKNGKRLYSKATLGGNVLKSFAKKDTTKNTTTTTTSKMEVKKGLESAKLKIKAGKNVKITGIVTAYIDKNGKVAYSKSKNGGKIKLSSKYEDDWTGIYGSQTRSRVKNTYVLLSYKDTFLKTSCTYSIVKVHGVKQIKEVYKAADGTKYTNYYDYGDRYDLQLWSY